MTWFFDSAEHFHVFFLPFVKQTPYSGGCRSRSRRAASGCAETAPLVSTGCQESLPWP